MYDDKGRILENSSGTYTYNATKPYQNNSIALKKETVSYYANREGIYNDTMESRTGWGAERYPNTNFFSYDDTKVPHADGKNTLKLSNTTTTEQYLFSDKWIEIDNAVPTLYTYSAWVYSDNAEAQMFLFMADGLNNITHDNVVTNTTGSWTQITKTFLVPSSVKRMRIRLDNNTQGNVWFDDVKIRKTNDPFVAERELNASYNVFKSPVTIEETGVDKISFDYSDNNKRSAMFYGSLNNHTDKLLRPNHKYYSNDGSMEIRQNITTGVVEFVTYISGDAYSAPIVFKSDGETNQNYLYLQRDYQGSIVAITGQDGAVVEKRLFDAWGNIIKVQDGTGNTLAGLTVLDRGYTGHEHLQSVNIIHMNGRLYDSKLHRFLQLDNNIQDLLNTQNYNRYAYVLNNPLKYTDPSGESIFGLLAGFFFSAYVHGGAASGGEANPFKWDSNSWVNAFSGAASSLVSSSSTLEANNYIDNYSNKPDLGASAISPGNNSEYIHSYVSTDNTSTSKYNKEAFAYAGVLSVGLVADDATVVGVVDDVLIPVAWGVATTVFVWDNREVIRNDASEIIDAIHRSFDPRGFHYVTYTKTSLDGTKVYVGRSSGYNTPEQIVKNRDANHHMQGYNAAQLTSSLPATLPGGYFSRYHDSSYWSIRGSEQIQIEMWREKGMSANSINGIGPKNDHILKYIEWGIKLLF